MTRQESQPIENPNVCLPRGEKLAATYAGRHVREYDSFDPRLVIDIVQNGNYMGKIIADRHTSFETGTAISLDQVELISARRKARLIFAIGKSIFGDNGTIWHEVYSPEGIIGYAFGDNLDFYLASLLHDDPKIKEKVQNGEGGFDEEVQRYLERELGLPGLFDQ